MTGQNRWMEKAKTAGHPRMLFDAERLKKLRQALKSSAPLQEAEARLIYKAEEMLEQDLVSEQAADGENSQHGNYGIPSGQLRRMGLTLGLAYQLTGEMKYAEKLKKALLHYGKYEKWHGRGLLERPTPWHSELNTVNFCFGYAIGFDCIQDILSPQERSAIVEAVIKLGILPIMEDWVLAGKRVHALDSMGHNWWNVCVAGAALASLAILGEDPRAPVWLEEATDVFELWFSYKGSRLQNKSANFDRHGAFYESVTYAEYGLEEYLCFRICHWNTFGRSLPGFDGWEEKLGAFFLHTGYPSSVVDRTVNFGDNGRSNPGVAAAKLLLAVGCGMPELRWLISRREPEWNELDMLYHEEIRTGASARPDRLLPSAVYPDIGWALLRSSWCEDAAMLAVKSGFTWNHAHADAASFELYHNGMPLLIDSGSCSYGRKEYRDYYCQSRAHNVILFNGRGQDPEDHYRGVKQPGTLHGYMEYGPFKYVYADATGPMAQHFSRNYRHFLWVHDTILIYDDVRSHEPGTFQWLLHYAGSAQAEREAIGIVNGKAEAHIRTLYPQGLTVEEEIGLADHDPERQRQYLSFSTTEESREAKFLTAIMLKPPAGQERSMAAGIEAMEGNDWLGARLRSDGQISDLYVNLRADGRNMHDNSNLRIGDWETDAYLFALTRETSSLGDQLEDYRTVFISCGSYLRYRGRTVFDSLSKATTAFRLHEPELHLTIQGQPVMRVSIFAGGLPDRIGVNGKEMEARYDSDHQLVRISVTTELPNTFHNT